MCFYTTTSLWGPHVASHARWSRLWHLPGAPKMQIALARCDTSTINVHKSIPIFVLRMKKQWHDSLIPDIQLVHRAIPLSSTADFCCLKLQTAGIVMVLKRVLSQFPLLVPGPPGQPDLEGEIGLNWAGGEEAVLQPLPSPPYILLTACSKPEP